jgi:predicted DNA-binding transcriptional regulator YafY
MEPALATASSRPLPPPDTIDIARVRTAIRAQGKIALVYRDEKEDETRRIIWPIAVSYWEAVRLIVAWCELRNGFRHFRTDRVLGSEFLEARYATPRAKLRAQWKKDMEESMERRARRMARNPDSPVALIE